MGNKGLLPLIFSILLVLGACSSEPSPGEIRTQQLSRACAIVSDWPDDYMSVWGRVVNREDPNDFSPSETMAKYIAIKSSLLDDLTDPDAVQILEDYKAYWLILERDYAASEGKELGAESDSIKEVGRLMKFCGQFDPAMRDILDPSEFVDTPPPKSVSAQPAGAYGSEISALQAEEWHLEFYGAPCSNPNDKTQECRMSTLLESRSVQLRPGDSTEFLDQSGSEVKSQQADVNLPMNVWCFKTKDFSRSVYESSGEIEFFEDTTYSFSCYFLRDTDGNGDVSSDYMGNLLPDGSIGLSPTDKCLIESGFGLDDLDAYAPCPESAKERIEPDW